MTRLAPTPTTGPVIARRPAPPVDPIALCVAVATAYVEVRAGRRPPDQLRPLLGDMAQRQLHALVERCRREQAATGGFSVTRVATFWPHDTAVEVVAVLRDSRGATAVAVRADHQRGRWWVTDVGAPEDRQAAATSRSVRSRRWRGSVRIRDTS